MRGKKEEPPVLTRAPLFFPCQSNRAGCRKGPYGWQSVAVPGAGGGGVESDKIQVDKSGSPTSVLRMISASIQSPAGNISNHPEPIKTEQ